MPNNVVQLTTKKKNDNVDETHKKIINAFIEIITREDFSAATNKRIADKAGVSVGKVQYHFSTKSKMLEAVLERCNTEYLQLIENKTLLTGSYDDRVMLFVSLAWRHYQSDIYLATLEILMVTRGQRELAAMLTMSESQAVMQRQRIREIFPECQLDDRELREAIITLNSYLAGLCVHTVLVPSLVNIGGYIRRARIMFKFLLRPETFPDHIV